MLDAIHYIGSTLQFFRFFFFIVFLKEEKNMSITSMLFRLEIAMAFRTWFPNPARFGEIPEMFVLRQESSAFHQ